MSKKHKVIYMRKVGERSCDVRRTVAYADHVQTGRTGLKLWDDANPSDIEVIEYAVIREFHSKWMGCPCDLTPEV